MKQADCDAVLVAWFSSRLLRAVEGRDHVNTPEPHDTPEGTAVNLGMLYRYETKRGVRYVLSHWRRDGSPQGFMITRAKLHEKIDELLDALDRRPSSPAVSGRTSKKWKGEE